LYDNSEPSATAKSGALCPKERFHAESRAAHLAGAEAAWHIQVNSYRQGDLTNMCIVANAVSSVVLIPTFVRILTNHLFEGLLGCTGDSGSHSDFKAGLLVFAF